MATQWRYGMERTVKKFLTEEGEYMLSEQERKFAEEHHDLIYWYLHSRNLDIEEYYDVAAIGYCKAVEEWHRKERLQEYKFSTIANWQMRVVINNELRRKSCQKRRARTVSLDQVITEEGGKTMADILPDTKNTPFRVSDLMMIIESDMITDQQREIIGAKLKGLKQSEIAQICKVNQATVSRQLKQIREVIMV